VVEIAAGIVVVEAEEITEDNSAISQLANVSMVNR